jgi:hypothetical protein
VQVDLYGALIRLKPTQPLRYSRRYELLVDTGEPTVGGSRMRATTGGTLSRNGGLSLDLGSADGPALRPGIYFNAYSSGWCARPVGVPTLGLASGQIRPASVQGEFVIHELEVDSADRITWLALDFTAPEGSGPVGSSGAVRINSAWALPPRALHSDPKLTVVP